MGYASSRGRPRPLVSNCTGQLAWPPKVLRPSWLSVALWADELAGGKPDPADVEAALSWLAAERAA